MEGDVDTLRLQREKIVVRAEIPVELKTKVLGKLEKDGRYASFSHLVRRLLHEYVEQEEG